MTQGDVWYRRYEEIRQEVESLRSQIRDRCHGLGVPFETVMHESRMELIARAVHESNWQEGIELAAGRTMELATAAFDEVDNVAGPHLDMSRLLRRARDRVLELKKNGNSPEEIATYNLAVAHQAVEWIGSELASRQSASLAQSLDNLASVWPRLKDTISEQHWPVIERGLKTLQSLKSGSGSVAWPLGHPLATEGELVTELLRLDPQALLHPMKISYIHFLHRLTLMSILPVRECGRFRRVSVHVGNPQLHFPVPSAIPGLMEEFCLSFPTILPSTVKYDPIRTAADVSHRFVAIHPYVDGNGRVARLLMNLVLWQHHPPVYLKADKKGRHRYSQALRRADRGSKDAMAALIAASLIEIYQRLLRSLQR